MGAQHVTVTFIAGKHPIGDEKSNPAAVLGYDAHGIIKAVVRAVFLVSYAGDTFQ